MTNATATQAMPTTDGILDSLATAAGDARVVGPGRWAFNVKNGVVVLADARREDGWLELTLPVPANDGPMSLWELLGLNRKLEVARLTLDPARSGVVLGAEIPVVGGEDCSRRIDEACCDFSFALELIKHGKANRSGSTRPDFDEDWKSTIADLCAEGGWNVVREGDDGLVVELDASGEIPVAHVEKRVAGCIDMSVEIARLGEPSRDSREALGLLLLGVNGAVRYVSARVESVDVESNDNDSNDNDNNDVTRAIRIGRRWNLPVSAREVHLGLGACSAAVAACQREVKVLENESCARDYLAMRNTAS